MTVLVLVLGVVFGFFYVPALKSEIDPVVQEKPRLPNTLPAALITPKPDYTPREVVEIVFDALASNDEPHANAGLATAWAFASTEVQARREGEFLMMAMSGMYHSIFRAATREVMEVQKSDSLAAYDVTGLTRDQEPFSYRVYLNRRFAGQKAGSWLVMAIVRGGQGRELPTTLPRRVMPVIPDRAVK